MDKQEYLNQISAKNRPVKNGSKLSRILSSKIFLIGAIGLAVFIMLAIIGGALSSGRGNELEKSYALKLHLDNTSKEIDAYQKSVKSSTLRSYSASLMGILTDTNGKLTDYLTEKYNFKEKDIPKDVVSAADLARDGLESDLFEAKINGTLDRVYASKMAYEISVIAAEEASLIKSTNDDNFKDVLTNSYNSLNNLYGNFNDFSTAN